jgi:RNA polymerase sigma-70 factor (ECF subfamily)
MTDQDVQAFSRFCETSYPPLVRALSLYCGSLETAQEVAQEACARAFRDWRKVSRLDDPKAWLFRVGFNTANSHFRRLSAERRATARIPPGSTTHSDPDAAERLAVLELLASLPKKQRAVLILRFEADLSVAEVAELLSLPEGTVKTLTRRALASLRESPAALELREVNDVV